MHTNTQKTPTAVPLNADLFEHRGGHVDLLARTVVAMRVQRNAERPERFRFAPGGRTLDGNLMDGL